MDQVNLREALDRAELLCLQVNEGVKEKENADRLEWLQNHVQCDGVIEVIHSSGLKVTVLNRPLKSCRL